MNVHEVTIYICGVCGWEYDRRREAEECCTEDDSDEQDEYIVIS